MSDLDLINFLEWLDADQHLLTAPAGDQRTLEDIAHTWLDARTS